MLPFSHTLTMDEWGRQHRKGNTGKAISELLPVPHIIWRHCFKDTTYIHILSSSITVRLNVLKYSVPSTIPPTITPPVEPVRVIMITGSSTSATSSLIRTAVILLVVGPALVKSRVVGAIVPTTEVISGGGKQR